MGIRRFWYFLKLTRPVFLLGGVVLYLLGALVAVRDGAVLHPGRLLIGQLLVTSIQVMTHYANEYFDLQCDMLNNARTWFSGGSGMLSAGVFSPETARRAALLAASVAVIAWLVAGAQVPVVLLLGALSLLAAWYYSAPPLALVSTGFGELTASLVVALMVPLVGCAMQTGGAISTTLLVFCLPLVLIHFAMLLAFEIPDLPADREAGKRTLTVRMGLDRVTRLHNGLLLLAFLVIGWLYLRGWPGAQLAWAAAPLALWQIYSIGRYRYWQPPDQQSNRRFLWLTMGAIGLFAFSAMLLLGGTLFQIIA